MGSWSSGFRAEGLQRPGPRTQIAALSPPRRVALFKRIEVWALCGASFGGKCAQLHQLSEHPTPLSLSCLFLLTALSISLLSPRDPCIQIIPTLGPKVCKYYLHWAIWIPRGTSTGSCTFTTKYYGQEAAANVMAPTNGHNRSVLPGPSESESGVRYIEI